MFASARDLFESAREASRDMARIRRQLDAMEHRASSLGSGGFEPRVRSTHDPDRMGGAVVTKVDMEERLRERYDDDRRLVDMATSVLYGDEGGGGLWALVGWRADAIAQHYLHDLTWAQVGDLLCYSEQHVWREAMAALETCDAWGIDAVMQGRGRAED